MNCVETEPQQQPDSISNHPPQRVLFVSHAYVVGVNQGKLDAVAATGAAEVGLIVPRQWKAVQWDKLLEFEQPYPRIQIYPIPVWFNGRSGAYLYHPLAVLQAIVNFRPDVIQVEQEVFSLSAFELACLAKLLKKPMVLFGWENMDRQLSPLRQWIRQFVFSATQCIIAGNHEGAGLVRQWGYKGTVEIMPQMGVDTDLFSPQLRQGTDPSELRIGYVGRISHHKGIDTLIEAAGILHRQGHAFRLVLCGSGQDEATFRKQAEDADLGEAIDWRGGVRHDQVPQEMGKMDVLVLPSRTIATWKEQFGHVLIEAMAMGIPTVGSDSGEIPNVIGRSDLVFAEGNAEALAAILARLITEPTWRSEMEQYSLNRVAQQYSHSRIAERLLDLWCDVLHPDRHPNASDAAMVPEAEAS